MGSPGPPPAVGLLVSARCSSVTGPAELPAATRPTREDSGGRMCGAEPMPGLGLSEACLGRDAAGRHGLTQSVVVALVLIGVGLGE